MQRSSFTNSCGIQLHFVRSGSGRPMVFQHGLGAEPSQPMEVFPEDAGAELLVMQCRGHGDSELGPPAALGVRTFADDLKEFLDALEIERCVVGGISLGAAVAVNFAVRNPHRVEALVLARPGWFLEAAPKNLAVFTEIATLIERLGPERGLDAFAAGDTYRKFAGASPDNAASLLGQFGAPDAYKRASLLSHISMDGPGISAADLEAVSAPTLVIGNELDLIHPVAYAKALAAHIPNAKYVEVTAKSVSRSRYVTEFRGALCNFLQEQARARVG